MAKRVSRGLALRGLLVTMEQISVILNGNAKEETPRVIAKKVGLNFQQVEEVLDYCQRNQDREQWIQQLADRALAQFWPETERGKSDPHTPFLAFRDATGCVVKVMYRHYLDDEEALVGRHLDTEADRQAARVEVEALGRLETVAA